VDTGATFQTITHNLAGDIGTSTILKKKTGADCYWRMVERFRRKAALAFSFVVVSASWNTTIYRTARSINAMTVALTRRHRPALIFTGRATT
jgi:hypothetical protein